MRQKDMSQDVSLMISIKIKIETLLMGGCVDKEGTMIMMALSN